MESAVISLLDAMMNIKVLLLARIFKLRRVFIAVEIAVLSDQSVLLLEFVWGFLTDSVCLSWEGSNTHILIESLAVYNEFEDMPFLHVL
jgi:hypothetical protein